MTGARDLIMNYTIVMMSADLLHHDTVSIRYAQKQGSENRFNGPLREVNLRHPPSAPLAGNQAMVADSDHEFFCILQKTSMPQPSGTFQPRKKRNGA